MRVGIVGASGYAGAELMRLLSGHGGVELARVMAGAAAGKRVDDIYPRLTGSVDLLFEPFEPVRLRGLDLVFVALPSGESMSAVPKVREATDRVIDLGGDFRLKSVALYEEFYGHHHAAPELVAEAVYGLPEFFKASIADARLVANPGCYPTSVLLPLLPLLREGMVDPRWITVSSVSGLSGAGRSAAVEMSFAEINENVRAYKVGRHQHVPEMESVIEQVSGKAVRLTFAPHLVPLTRGIYTTIVARLAGGVREQNLHDLYTHAFAEAPFVRIRGAVPQITDVLYTNYCDFSWTVEPRTGNLIVNSTIDNLVKGAAGQAIQNMNIMLGLPESTGLQQKEHCHA